MASFRAHAESSPSEFKCSLASPPEQRKRETGMVQLLIARNPDTESTLPYLMLVPISGGLVFRTK